MSKVPTRRADKNQGFAGISSKVKLPLLLRYPKTEATKPAEATTTTAPAEVKQETPAAATTAPAEEKK